MACDYLWMRLGNEGREKESPSGTVQTVWPEPSFPKDMQGVRRVDAPIVVRSFPHSPPVSELGVLL